MPKQTIFNDGPELPASDIERLKSLGYLEQFHELLDTLKKGGIEVRDINIPELKVHITKLERRGR